MTFEVLVRRLATTTDTAGVRRVLARARQPRTVALVEQLADAVTSLTRVDVTHAGRISEAAAYVARALDDPYAIGRATRAQGHVLALLGQSERALSHYEQALADFERSGRPLEAAITRSGALQMLIYLGRYEDAFAWADHARATFRRERDDLRLARLDTNVANILHRQDRFAEARRLYARAARTLARVGSPQDVGIALRNLAVCEISLNDFDAALTTHRRAKRLSNKHNLPLLALQADYNIAYLYYLRGEYSKAIELYEVTRRRSERVGDRPRLALCDMDEAEISLELNLTDDAIRLAAGAVERFTELGLAYEAAKTRTFAAMAWATAGHMRKALAEFATARRAFRREGNRPWLARLDLYMALVLLETAKPSRAEALARSARAEFTRSGLDAKSAVADLVLARLALRSGDAESARQHCETAVARLEHSQSRALRFQAAFVLAQAFEALGHVDLAARALLDAYHRLEQLRGHLRTEETKIAFLSDKLVVYESVVAMVLAGSTLVSPLETFTVVEQAKSRSLSDLIAFRTQIAPRSPRSRGAARRLQSVRESLTWCYREIDTRELTGHADANSLTRLRARAEELERALTKTLDEVSATDDEYASLHNAGTAPLDAVQACLPDDTLLLEYYEARGRLVVFLIGRSSFEMVPLGPAAPVHDAARLLRFQLSKFRMGEAHLRAFTPTLGAATATHLRTLYEALIEPVARRVLGRRLVIVPHGILHDIPFHALHDGDHAVCDASPVSYAPSASLYRLCRLKRVPAATRGALVLGVSDDTAPAIDDEIAIVASALPGARVYRGRGATAVRLAADGPKCRTIHITASSASTSRSSRRFSSATGP